MVVGPGKLILIGQQLEVSEFPINKQIMTIGRIAGNCFPDIPLNGASLSRQQGEIIVQGQDVFYEDKQSTNGTIIDGLLYGNASGAYVKQLIDGDILEFGVNAAKGVATYIMIYIADASQRLLWQNVNLSMPTMRFGSNASGNNDIVIKQQGISRSHMNITHQGNVWGVMDNNSTNGTFLNGVKIKGHVQFNDMNVIRLGYSYLVRFGQNAIIGSSAQVVSNLVQVTAMIDPYGNGMNGNIVDVSSQNKQKIETPKKRKTKAVNNGRTLTINITERTASSGLKKLTLLKDINMNIQSGEMVLILGGSGAGKTTFMNAVMGYEKATGTITYAGKDIYRDYDSMKYEIGFVPQDILLRENDTVYKTLLNSASMKLPQNTPQSTRDAQIQKVMDMMTLNHVKDSLIKSISGGEKKRVSAGVELISDPSLFFLDEPDSGLDAKSAMDLMNCLRSIADTGKIVMIISHSPDRAADLFDKVIVLVKSKENCGRLAFLGSVDEAYKFFGAESLEGVVSKINGSPEDKEAYINKWNQQVGMQR